MKLDHPGSLQSKKLQVKSTFGLINPLTSTISLDSSIGSVLICDARGLGFKSRLSQWNSFKFHKFLFLIEDISELEC